ncbi:hypothetical protein HLB23_19240 [Nocardia uniformis]|uniref:Uncharacterized protein n=1 Tax=Nocardia uniformis TaxID=53432 RepID=A0A849C047_9NOCA|nr:hypothetical protein [Nocardia uniformis]NNH71964.1 hypothetical protein [Nocardia uniformis]
MPVLRVNSVLAETAFGATPGRAAIELPAPADATESWLRAVSLGGVGHYAAARAELDRARRRTRDPVLRSLVHSTEGSLLRQLGWHALAAVSDGRAAALVLPDLPVAGRHPAESHAESGAAAAPYGAVTAVCDAVTGLAADALGTARPALAARLLNRCRIHLDTYLPDPEYSWRPRIRLHWVSAETALYHPGAGLIAAPTEPGWVPELAVPGPASADPALAHAEAASALSERSPSVRHRVKSRLIVAAAAAAGGDLDRARALADEVARQSLEFDLLPLRWACAMLRAGIDPASDGASEASECAMLLAARGGRLRSAS